MASILHDTVTTSPLSYVWDGLSFGTQPEPMTVEIEEDAPVDSFTVPVSFQGGSQIVILECYDDGTWIASFRDSKSIFAGGDTAVEAVVNLELSAQEDLDILREYGENVTNHLRQQRRFLESLFVSDSP